MLDLEHDYLDDSIRLRAYRAQPHASVKLLNASGLLRIRNDHHSEKLTYRCEQVFQAARINLKIQTIRFAAAALGIRR